MGSPGRAPVIVQASAPATRLCLVRHGETEWNAERRLQGHLDIPLNARGLAQAASTARGLSSIRFNAAYCSDLSRARQTADAILRDRDARTTLRADLRERHYGIFQGKTYEEIASTLPDDYRRFKRREADYAFPGGGESLAAFARRVEAALVAIAQRHAGEDVLVVTHGGVLDIAHRLATGKALGAARDFAIPNAALNWLEHGEDGWRILVWADVRHIDDALDELPNA